MAAVSQSERLREAVINGDLDRIKKLTSASGNSVTNYDPSNGWTSLHYAASVNSFPTTLLLLDLGHEDKGISRDLDLNTALMVAIQHGHVDIFTLLCRRCPQSINVPNKLGWTALFVAARYHRPEMMLYLVDNCGADINSRDKEGSTPLHYASAYNALRCVHVLIDRGCDATLKNNAGWKAVDWAYSNKVEHVINELLSRRSKGQSTGHGEATEQLLAAPVPQAVADAKDQRHKRDFSFSRLGKT